MKPLRNNIFKLENVVFLQAHYRNCRNIYRDYIRDLPFLFIFDIRNAIQTTLDKKYYETLDDK